MFTDTRHLRYLIRTRPAALVGVVIVAVALMLALVGPSVAPFDPTTAIPGDQLQPPSFSHFMGTDGNGMDVFSRVIASPPRALSSSVKSTAEASPNQTMRPSRVTFSNGMTRVRPPLCAAATRGSSRNAISAVTH